MLTNQVEYPTEPRQGMNPLVLSNRDGCEVLVAWLVKQVAHLDRRGWSP